MKEYLSVGEASLELGVCVKTLHRWEKSKKLLSSFRTFGNHRRYLKYDVLKIKNKESVSILDMLVFHLMIKKMKRLNPLSS
jgi:DNA-binding transcriptional MerR regulator